ncbi:bifunctional [glutamate--ammonia ligase]-adenylyl-L-tyrosine phosphorylase/[glutamate--ammonia-ligase] adenylyltransferase [Desulfosarcina ovata]|uniref:Glutamate-ammonia-ligase adenylyltransferase n=2 Tax=Desulfosarcina ovata TaxID=83564 RepID=A0A5K8ACM5_9BACT|nr:bifunctional [glutamate--ammonia ligase]-adenylyl-L-tyrosine phosphorylase/[glutamate--ammonia-ligase] adenylyltransferase [Desulfosarcina ovata]BBO83882.1 glutamate-ammonia-ligase adenylyltransferase [Desulfosarcina ovata subsp. sediminis]BBO90375.1 glutamate-ammonia-ligase adenylyltransferase [Desulfosarcina ovata subsp. ovata]
MTGALNQQLEQQQRERWTTFCKAVENADLTLSPDTDAARALAGAFGFSEFVSSSCIRYPQMAIDLIDSQDLTCPYGKGQMVRRVTPLLQAAVEAAPDGSPEQLLVPMKAALRTFRRREMVRIAVRDLSGISRLDETTGDLSTLAAAAIDGALEVLYARMCEQNGIPQSTDGRRQHLVVLGMGKLGAGELNFSSDVDLIFAFPSGGESRGGPRPMANAEFFTRLCRLLIQAIGETTADGFVFRVDTRLRPYGDGGPLVMPFDHMEDYYQSQGREWERYALIKADVIAGDRQAGRDLLLRLRPFVFRRYLDFGVFESLREMKRKITAEVRRKKLHGNIKLGSGGIREVEFFGQMFQLIRGGVLPTLQQPAIQTVLDVLAGEGFVPPEVCHELIAAYRFLRNTENRIQEANDQQTHALPTAPLARLALARAMNFSTWEDFRQALDHHRSRVRTHFDGLLATEAEQETGKAADSAAIAGLTDAWTASLSTAERRRILKEAGFSDSDTAATLLEHFKAEPGTRALSGAGRRRMDRLLPRVLEAAALCDDPETVLERVLHLLKQIQQRISYLSLLLEYPTALTHLIRLVGASPWIAAFLSRHPVLLDELLDPRSLYAPPKAESLRAGLARQLAAVPDDDPEYQMEVLRIFRQINTLRVAASDITNVLPLMKVSDHLTWIAETILEAVVDTCWTHLVAKHGRPTCTLDGKPCEKGFAVIGYGKLGGLELGYGSDLDLVFLHAADSGATVGGRQPIDNTHFFARLGQRVVHMLSAHTAAGKLYETDMRLRPNGSSGLLVSHVNGFDSYQMENAWTWEHQALIRARPITGDAALLDAFTAIRRKVLCLRREPGPLITAVRDMRERMRKSRLSAKPDRFDIKEDTGAMIDIEFIVQYLVLQHASDHPQLVRWTDNVRLLQSLSETGIVDSVTAHRLRQTYLIYRAAVHRLNLGERSTLVDGRRFQHMRTFVQRFWQQTMKTS